MGAYVVRTSSLNDRMGLRDKTTATAQLMLALIKGVVDVGTIFSSLAFLSSSVSMANLSRFVAVSLSSLSPVLLFFLFCLHGQPELFASSSLRFLSNSL